MKPMRWTLTHYKVARACLLAIFFPLTGCAGEVNRSWSEEVALDDGKTIVIEREVKFRESNSLGGDAYSSADLQGVLRFTGDQFELPAWSVPLTPILLFRDQNLNEWVIVATTSNCDTWDERDKPEPPYWEYRLRAGGWVQVELSEMSKGRKSNLFFDYEPALPAKKLTLEAKQDVLSGKDFVKKYLRIVPDLKSRCR